MADKNDEIIRIAAKGDGVTGDGRFVALSAPGDWLAADGSLVHGPHHVTPPCRHFESCGGCTLQQLDEASQTGFLHDRIAHAAASQGLEIGEMLDPHLSPPRSRRRASLKTLRRGNSVEIGFNKEASHSIVNLVQCEILEPALFALVEPLRGLLRQVAHPRGSGKAELVLLDQGIDLYLDSVELKSLQQHEAMSDFARQHGLARLTVEQGFGPETIWEPEPVTIMLSGVAVGYPTGAFLQATLDGEQALITAASEFLDGATIVADLFAGLGTFALSLAPGRKIYAAEAARDSVLALKTAANARQLAVFTDHRDLFRNPLQAEELDRFDAVLLDPPRAGARDQIEQIAKSKLRKLVYASCNPSSWSRDGKKLIDAGFTLSKVRAVGQFRWSTHVELVSLFERG